MTPLHLVLRNEGPEDEAAIDALLREAFAGHPFSRQTEHHIVRQLRASATPRLSLVALSPEGALWGHVTFSAVKLNEQDVGWWGLGPLAVRPSCQRQGVGSALVRSGLRRLEEHGAAGCVVLGDPAYYARFAFRPEPGLVLPGAITSHFQALALRGEVPLGEVSYPGAFSAAG